MYFQLKESQINNWWIAYMNSKLTFFDISSQKIPKKKLVVVGYPKSYGVYLSEITVSTNYVSKVTGKGIVTENGSFYPFEAAHPLYLRFLVEAKDDIVIASNWKFNKNGMHADIIKDGETKEEVTFDFTPDGKTDVLFKGYSKDLGANVILNTFSRKDVYTKLQLPHIVEADIYVSSIVKDNEKKLLLNRVVRML